MFWSRPAERSSNQMSCFETGKSTRKEDGTGKDERGGLVKLFAVYAGGSQRKGWREAYMLILGTRYLVFYSR